MRGWKDLYLINVPPNTTATIVFGNDLHDSITWKPMYPEDHICLPERMLGPGVALELTIQGVFDYPMTVPLNFPVDPFKTHVDCSALVETNNFHVVPPIDEFVTANPMVVSDGTILPWQDFTARWATNNIRIHL